MYEKYCKIRDQKGYRDSDVAKGAGITKSTFSDWKSGRSNPKNEKLIKIANFLEVPVECFFPTNENASVENSQLTKKDNRDIKKDLDNIMKKLSNKEYGPAAYDGKDLSEESMELFRDELEIALKRLKLINKEKYNPNKNKK